MMCISALSIFGILGIFSVKYRSLAREAFHCVFRKIKFKPCETGLDERMKSKVTARLVRIPGIAKFWRKHYQLISWIFVISLLGSFYFSTSAIYNIVRYGSCEPNEPCALISFPRRLLTPFTSPSYTKDSLGTYKVEIVLFYETGCSHYVQTIDFLEQRIKPNYPVEVERYEINRKDNIKLAGRLANIYGVKLQTPMIFVGDTSIQVYNDKSLLKLEKAVRRTLRTQLPSPLSRIKK